MIFTESDFSKRLIEGCLKKDRHAQKRLFDLYKDAMYTVVYRILRNEDLACDAVQEGFLQVFRSIGSFRHQSTIGAWIRTIMVRSALRILKREPEKSELTELTDITIEWDFDLTGEMLDKAIAELSPGYRTVFLLIEVEGYTHKEVAEIMNISEGTSKSQLFRAKELLQKKLKGLRN